MKCSIYDKGTFTEKFIKDWEYLRAYKKTPKKQSENKILTHLRFWLVVKIVNIETIYNKTLLIC